MSLATLTRQPLRTPIAPTPSRDHLRAVPAHVARTARRSPAHGVGEPAGAHPAPHGRGLRQLRPRREHPGARVGQGGRRRRPAHLLLGPPRQRLRLQGHLGLVRAGPRRGRRLRRRPRRRPGRLHPQHHRLPQPARPQPAARHDDVRLRDRAPRRAAAVEPRAAPSACPSPAASRTPLVLLGDALAASPDGPRLVVVAGASNVTGELWPVDQLADLARQHGARVALDAAQLAPHVAVDVAALGVDYVAFSGHKLYAPFGAGVLVGRADWLNDASPYLRGGGATAQVTSRSVRWAEGAARHEAGSPNVVGAIALAAACATLTAHRETVEAHEDALATRLRDGPGRDRGRAHLLAVRRRPRPRRRRHLHRRRAGQLAGVGGPVRGVRHRRPRRQVLRAPARRRPAGRRHRGHRDPGQRRAWPTPPSTSTGCCARWPTLAATGPAFDYALTADGWVPAAGPARPVPAAPLVRWRG